MAEPASPADAYQTYFAPSIFGPLAQRVLPRAQPRPGESVLDVACGTGILTRELARAVAPGGRVVGVDINPSMVRVARSVPRSGGVEIEYREGDGTKLDLPDASFDLVACQQGLQFFPDRAAGVAQMARVLKPGGRVAIAAWESIERHPLFRALADAEEPHLRTLGVSIGREELVAPFSLPPDELATLLEKAGFRDVRVSAATFDASFDEADRFVERMEYAYAAVIPQFAADPAAFRRYLDAIARDTRATVEAYRRGDRIVTPMHTSIATATR